uniref:Uncharacterized protein n=1 Tax=Avena sativa TaxID=4498 RepID=A0ACD5TS71_AVESA
MEQVLVSVATGALKPVLGKLATLLSEEYKLVKGVRGKIMFLQAELEAMHAFLLKMSQVEEPDEQARCWMKEVRELSYDIHNSIDDFMLRVDDKSVKPKGVKGFIKRSMNLLTETKTRHRIGKEIKSLEILVKEVAERRARYRIDDNISKATNVTVDPRVCALYKDISELVGFDEPTEELIKLLNAGEELMQPLKVVSIVGVGGLGKTTLARHVYDTYGEEFKYRAFVSVSRNPNMVTLLRSILIQLGYDKYLPEDAQCLLGTISDFIKDKRYFIVIDDVWDIPSWDIIKSAFCRSSCGSKIITTTRVHEVAKSCCLSKESCVYNLRPLSTVDSKMLFLQRIFGSEKQCPSHLKRLSDKILEKCSGLPLAIISISGLLANTREDQWENVNKSIGCGLGSNPAVQGMMKILSFSYFDLSPCLKSCLLYLSIYPEDFEIDKKHLIMRWIAEGFIPMEDGHTLYELGERCFNELINRSLIQPGEFDNLCAEVTKCRVHDIILDFVISKSKEENFVTLLGLFGVNPDPKNKARRLSLQGESEIPDDLDLCNARSLIIFERSVNIPSWKKFKNLRVLNFELCKQLEHHHLVGIGNLFHLKHLRFKHAKLEKFPDEIAKLQFLETLEILANNSELQIPSTICQLQNLTHLVVDYYIILPDKIGSMKALQVLEGINVFNHSVNFVRQLGTLSNLRKLAIQFWDRYCVGKLPMSCRWIEDESSTEKELLKQILCSICMLGNRNLYSVCVSGDYKFKPDDCDEDGCNIDDTDVFYDGYNIDALLDEPWFSALGGFRELIIMKNFVPCTLPRSMKSLLNIQKLCLEVQVVCDEHMVILGGLPALHTLSLGAEDLVHLEISQSYGFPSLSHFIIGEQLHCAMGLFFQAGCMPRLEKLVLAFLCFTTDVSDDFDFGIGHLRNLKFIHCYYHKEELKVALERSTETHPNHPRFQWN